MDHQLNLPHYEDLRDKNFQLADYLASINKKGLRYKTWQIGEVDDQGPYNSCVGHACDQFLRSAPKAITTGPSPDDLFALARKIDNDPTKTGTSLRAGLKGLMQLGLVKNYYWADKIDEVGIGILNIGPVILGVDWYHSDINSAGKLYATSGLAGQHALVAYGVNLKESYFLAVNSWGYDWGSRGTCVIPFSILNKTLKYAIAPVKA